MKKLLTLAILLILGGAAFYACAGDTHPAPVKLSAPSSWPPYGANQLTISPFTGLTTPNLKLDDARQFTGLGIGYHLTSAIELSGEAAASDTDERAIDQFGAHGRGYVPLWKTSFALYGEIGWQRFNSDDRRDFLSTGAGAAFRGKSAGVRLGLRKLDDLKRGDLLQILLSAEYRF